MYLEKIIAGLIALVWDVESAFVQVDVANASVNRGLGTCTAGSVNVTITHCGQTISDALVNLIVNGVGVLNNLISGLSVGVVTRA